MLCELLKRWNVSSDRLPLGNIGRSASTASQSGTQKDGKEATSIHTWKSASKGQGEHVSTKHGSATQRLVQRYAMQATARELLPREAVAHCMRSVVPIVGGASGVNVLYTPVEAAHYSGLQMCKSVWLCPVCSAKISERRREELTVALDRWSNHGTDATHYVLFCTFTLQHHGREDLSDVLNCLTSARRRLVSGRNAAAFAADYGIVGMVRSLELTHGESGWHPHLHVLYFLDRAVPIVAFEADIKTRWSACVAHLGRYASWANGCDVRFSDAEIAAYIAKFGREPRWTQAHELTKTVSKLGRSGGRTPMQLLLDHMCGDARAGRLWLEYAVNMKGQRQLFMTPKLRLALGLGEEKTDEEIAVEQDETAVILASLSAGAWRAVVANDARAELLAVAATGQVGQVAAFLQELGIRA